MRRRLTRPLAVGVAAALLAAAAAGGALAAASRTEAPRDHGIGLGPLGFGGAPGGPPLAGPGRGPGVGFGGPAGPGGGAAGALSADVLDPAASYLGISLSTLESDLSGGKTLSDLAGSTSGKTASGLISAIVSSEQSVFGAEQSAGWITSAQESSLVSAFTNEVTNLVDNGPPVPPSPPAQSGGLLQTAATFLGVSLQTLQSDLQSGKTLADVASAQGDTVAQLVTALEAPAKTKLDSEVSAGTITAAQETSILNEMTTRLTNIVNGTHGNDSLNAVRQGFERVAGLEKRR